jgi:hypothetical protein
MADENKINQCEMTKSGGFVCSGAKKYCRHFDSTNPARHWAECSYYAVSMGSTCFSGSARKEAAQTAVRIGQEYLVRLANERDE